MVVPPGHARFADDGVRKVLTDLPHRAGRPEWAEKVDPDVILSPTAMGTT